MAILWQTSDPIATTDFSNGTGLVQNTGNVELSPVNAAASGRDGSATSQNVRYGYVRFRFDDLPENRVEFFGFGYAYQRAYLTIDQNGNVDVRGHNVGDIATGIMTVVEGVIYDVELYFNLDSDVYEVRNGGSNISSGSHTQGGSLRSFFVGNGELNGSLDTTVTYDLKVFQVVIDDSEFPFAGSTGLSMTGAVSLDLSVVGAMLVSEPMSGSVEIEVDVAGVMVIAPVMEGSMEIELSTTGDLLVSQPMTEDVAVHIGISGEMLVPVLMSGNGGIELSVAGTLLVDESVSGDVGVELAVSGDMDQPSGTVRIGKIVVGSMRTIGATQWNIKLSTIDYSKNITDDFGKTFRSVGKYAPQIEGTARAVSREDIDGIMTTFRDARATDCVWDFNENNFDLSALIVYGLLAEHYMIINQPNDYTIKFRIDGVV